MVNASDVYKAVFSAEPERWHGWRAAGAAGSVEMNGDEVVIYVGEGRISVPCYYQTTEAIAADVAIRAARVLVDAALNQGE